MLPYRLVLLTGTMGGGKSTVSSVLAKKPGIAIVNADEVAKAAIYKREHYPRLREILGSGVFEKGAISFSKVAEVFFRDPMKKLALEGFASIPVRLAIESEIKKASARPQIKVVIIENAIGLEKGWYDIYPFDTVVCVYCSEEEQLRRLMSARGYSEEDVRRRTKSHLPIAEKIRASDISVSTDGDIGELNSVVDELYTCLMES
jgi:dephospho-CoA kinase